MADIVIYPQLICVGLTFGVDNTYFRVDVRVTVDVDRVRQSRLHPGHTLARMAMIDYDLTNCNGGEYCIT